MYIPLSSFNTLNSRNWPKPGHLPALQLERKESLLVPKKEDKARQSFSLTPPQKVGVIPQCVEILTSRQTVVSATHSSWVPSNPSQAAMARVTGFVHRAPLIPFPSQMSITNLGIFFYLACDLLEGFPWHYH